VRAVLDANVLVSALLSRGGAPALLVERWLMGDFELVVSELLLAEVDRTFAAPKLRRRVTGDIAAEFVSTLRGLAEFVTDPETAPPVRSRDPGDDYLVALAASARATLVSGDAHLLELQEAIPVLSPREFLDTL
jgi:uncharacterized protein